MYQTLRNDFEDTLVVPIDEIQIDTKLNLVKELIEIMDRKVKRLKQIRTPIVKLGWNSKQGSEYTSEREDQMWRKYPRLFKNASSTR